MYHFICLYVYLYSTIISKKQIYWMCTTGAWNILLNMFSFYSPRMIKISMTYTISYSYKQCIGFF